MTSFVIVDNDGMPTGSVDMDVITTAGTKLAFDLAANASDPTRVQQISAQVLAEQGTSAFGLICATALRIVVEDILDPVLDVTETLGTDLRPGIRDVAEGRDPGAA